MKKNKVIVNNKNTESLNIGKNTRWDIHIAEPNAGSTIQKPSTGLNPDKNTNK